MKLLLLLVFSATSLYISAQQAPFVKLPVGHQQGINTISISQDGKLIVTGSNDNSFIIWEARTGLEIRRVQTPAAVQQVLFSPDGTYILTASGDNNAEWSSSKKLQMHQWEVKTGRLIAKLPFTGNPTMEYNLAGQLLVPNYSEDLTNRTQSRISKIDLNKPDAGMQELMMEEILKNDPTFTLEEGKDRKQKKNPAKERAENEKMKRREGESPEEYMARLRTDIFAQQNVGKFARNFTVLDGKTLKVANTLNGQFRDAHYLRYNNKNYLLSIKSEMESTGMAEVIRLWELQSYLSDIKASQQPVSEKMFKMKREPDVFSVSIEKGFFATAKRKEITLWQLEKAAPLASLVPKGDKVREIAFSKDGNEILVFSNKSVKQYNDNVKMEVFAVQHVIESWSTATLQPLYSLEFPPGFESFTAAMAFGDGYFTLAGKNGLLKYNMAGEILAEFKGHCTAPSYYGFRETNRYVYTNFNGYDVQTAAAMKSAVRLSAASMVDTENLQQGKSPNQQERQKQIAEKLKSPIYGAISPTENYGFTMQWDLLRGGASGQRADSISVKNDTVSKDKNYQLSSLSFEQAGKEGGLVGSQLMADMAKADKSAKGKEYAEFYDTTGGAYKTWLLKNVNGVATLLINRRTKDTISLIRIDSLDWIMLLKNGYYMSSRNAAKMLSYVKGMQVYPFAQFDLKYNRPDLVLRAIGLADAALIQTYKNAYVKRLKRMDIDSSQLNNDLAVPEAEFSNRDKIPVLQTAEKLTLSVVANDARYKLERFNIWVNEVPLFGKDGKSIKDLKSGKYATTVNIVLTHGVNRIETSVINSAGVESLREPLIVKYSPLSHTSDKVYFIGIGIDKFRDNSRNLSYCEKDIRDLSLQLKNKYGDALQTELLFNEQVTVQNIVALKKKIAAGTENDKLIVAYSGHGLISKPGYDYYLSTFAVDFTNPELEGLPYTEMENLFDGLRIRKKLLLLDACHSGELDKEELQQINTGQAALKKNSVVVGRGLNPINSSNAGGINSFELMEQLFVNVGRSTGTTVIAASAGTQFALERGDLRNGVFTYTVLELLENTKTTTVNQLKSHVATRVADLTQGLQRASARSEIQTVDWVLY